MTYILGKDVKSRSEINKIFICDCKRLIDLKIPLNFENTLKKLKLGIDHIEQLKKEEFDLFIDLQNLGMLSKFEIEQLSDLEETFKILDEELKDRYIKNEIIIEKFKKNPNLFLGAFVDDILIGVVLGYPREDYIVMSIIAVKEAFWKRGIGKKLAIEFEKRADRTIKVGSADNALGFYLSLEYKPFLLIQYKDGKYSETDFQGFNINKKSKYDEDINLSCEIEKVDLKEIKRFNLNYPNAYFQYIFVKVKNN